MGNTMRATLARRLKITDELKADVRRRFETTDEPPSAMAADLGCCIATLRNIAKREGWVRFAPPPRDLIPAARLQVRAEKLAEQGDAALSLPPRSGGEGRPPELAEQARADGVGGVDGVQEPPTPNPSPPRASHVGGGDEDAARAAQELQPEQLADSAEAIHAEVMRQLAELNAMRAEGKRLGLPERERAARTLASLTATLHRLQAMRSGVPLTESHTGNDYDDMPADIDEFRDALARRIEAFFESRPDAGDAAEPTPDRAAAAQ